MKSTFCDICGREIIANNALQKVVQVNRTSCTLRVVEVYEHERNAPDMCDGCVAIELLPVIMHALWGHGIQLKEIDVEANITPHFRRAYYTHKHDTKADLWEKSTVSTNR